MVQYVIGNIVEAPQDIVVNASNGMGNMGGFIARHFRVKGVAECINYVTNGKVEKEARKASKGHKVGSVFSTNGYGVGKLAIIHAITMPIPGWRSSLDTVRALLPEIAKKSEELGAKSVALPFLGCGVGHLKKQDVRVVYDEFFANYAGKIEFYVYDLK